MLREESRQRLAKEYRYAATKMQQAPEPARKLYYFSVLFGEAQRVLNWDWNQDVALIHLVTQQAYNQVNPTTQAPVLGLLFPIDGSIIYDQLTQTAADLAAYFEKTEKEASREQLFQIIARIAEISYAAGGNGSYLYEKGLIKF